MAELSGYPTYGSLLLPQSDGEIYVDSQDDSLRARIAHEYNKCMHVTQLKYLIDPFARDHDHADTNRTGGPGIYGPDDLSAMEEMMAQMGGGDDGFDPMDGMGGMEF